MEKELKVMHNWVVDLPKLLPTPRTVAEVDEDIHPSERGFTVARLRYLVLNGIVFTIGDRYQAFAKIG